MPSLNELLSHLETTKRIENRYLIDQHFNESAGQILPPLAVQILSAIGAIFATIILIAALVFAEIISPKSPLSFIVCGIIAMALSFALMKAGKKGDVNNFTSQSSVAAMAIAKALITFGVVLQVEDTFFSTWFGRTSSHIWVASLVLFFLTILTYQPYRNALDRFLSPLAFMVALQIAMTVKPLGAPFNWIMPNSIFLIELALGIWLLLDERLNATWRPLGLACLFFVAVVTAFKTPFLSEIFREKTFLSAYLVASGVAVAAIATSTYIASHSGRVSKSMILPVAALTVLLAAIGAEGILIGLLIIALGIHKSDYILKTAGLLILSLFIFTYYYDLNITLLSKSIILFVSGISLVTASYFVNHYVRQKGAA